MRLYLCGPVSLGGTCTPEQEAANIVRFAHIKSQLEAADFGVESPAEISDFVEEWQLSNVMTALCPADGVARWQWYLRRTVIQMLTCDAVATIGPVTASRGCLTEMFIANLFGMPIKTADEWLA